MSYSNIPKRRPSPRISLPYARSIMKAHRVLPRPAPRVSFPQVVNAAMRLKRFVRRRKAQRIKPSNIKGTVANVGFRYMGTKSFKGKMNPKMLKYKSSLKHSLTNSDTLQYQNGFNVAQLGTNKQAQSQWLGIQVLSPSLFDNILSGASNSATGAPSLIETFVENARVKLDIKSASNRGGRAMGYICYPRRDISATQALTTSGVNPTLLTQGFTDMLQSNQATSALSVTQAGVTPFDSTLWTRMFKMRPLFDKYFEPGQTLIVNLNWRKGLILDKARYGVKVGTPIATDYEYLKDCGPMLLVHFEGTPVHDETTATLPLNSNTSTVTLGGFNFDIVQQRYITVRTPYASATRATGNYSSLLAQAITGANEEAFVLSAYNETGDNA